MVFTIMRDKTAEPVPALPLPQSAAELPTPHLATDLPAISETPHVLAPKAGRSTGEAGDGMAGRAQLDGRGRAGTAKGRGRPGAGRPGHPVRATTPAWEAGKIWLPATEEDPWQPWTCGR